MQRRLVAVIYFFTKRFLGSSWGVPCGMGQRSFPETVCYVRGVPQATSVTSFTCHGSLGWF